MYHDRPCDFARWARVGSWLLEETTFILSSREPPLRDWLLPKTHPDELRVYEIPYGYEKIERWLRDSIEDGTLAITQDNEGAVWTTPGDVLTWARLNGFEIPQELARLIEESAAMLPNEKPLHENERRTLLKIIHALAKLHGVTPVRTREDGDGWRKAVGSLQSEFAKVGIPSPADEKTLAKHLRNAFADNES